eukprot:3391934-Heterocapsa_arctica.AAC.1
MEWLGTTKPNDDQIVPDYYMTNRRRTGSWLAARELLGAAEADASAVAVAPDLQTRSKAPSVSRPLSPTIGPRKARRVDSASGAGYGTGSAASSA